MAKRAPGPQPKTKTEQGITFVEHDDAGRVVDLDAERPRRMTPGGVPDERARLLREVVDDYNRTHALARIKGRSYILTEEPDEMGNPSYVLSGERDFTLFNRNRTVRLPKYVKGHVDWEEKQCGPLWLSHPDRRSITRITFKPSGDVLPTEYNIFHGWGVQPAPYDPENPERGCERILDLCRRLFGNAPQAYRWAMAWLADMVQNPSDKPGTAVVLRGSEGTGKGTLMNAIMGPILRSAYVHIANRHHLTGHFNSILQGTLLFFVDEAFWAGDKAGEGALKALITEPTLMIEGKGKDAFSMPNLARIVFASNESWVVPVGPTGRRFAVYDVDEEMARKTDYFDAVRKEAANGGLEAFFSYLLNFDMKGVDLRTPPITDALIRQKIETLRQDSVGHWFFERLYDGVIHGTDDSMGNGWPREITRERLRASYAAYCKRMMIKFPAGAEELGRFLKDKIGARDSRATTKAPDGSRAMLYRFEAPGETAAGGDAAEFRLAHFRGVFEREFFGGGYDWPEAPGGDVTLTQSEDDEIPY